MGWAHKVLDDTGGLMFLTTTLEDGRTAFYYLLMSRAKRPLLMDALQGGGKLKLEEFGEVVHSGWGSPTDDDKAFMREKYRAQT